MKKQTLLVKLPELSAKAYAELNNVETAYINAQCRAGVLPARKLTRDGVATSRDAKGTWFINLVELENIITRNFKLS